MAQGRTHVRPKDGILEFGAQQTTYPLLVRAFAKLQLHIASMLG